MKRGDFGSNSPNSGGRPQFRNTARALACAGQPGERCPRLNSAHWRQRPVANRLEWDVKLYFTLAGATHNAACAAWSIKRTYEGVRPITMIRYMGSKGQSGDPLQPSYHPQGLLLYPGVVEVITAESSAPGERHAALAAHIGKVAVYSWPGEPAHPANEVSRVRWMLATDWVPYQRKTFVTPAFPGYISGHSTFSRAAAEAITLFTGSPYFPGDRTFHRSKGRCIWCSKTGPVRPQRYSGPLTTTRRISPGNPAGGEVSTLPRMISRLNNRCGSRQTSVHGISPENSGTVRF